MLDVHRLKVTQQARHLDVSDRISPCTLMLTIDKTLCTLSPEDIMESVEIFYDTYYDVFQKKFSGTDSAADNTVFLGGGSGFVSKTIVYALYGEQEAIHTTKDIFEKTNVPREHKHGMDPRLGVSPHILKCTHYRGKEYMMGQCEMKIIGFCPDTVKTRLFC